MSKDELHLIGLLFSLAALVFIMTALAVVIAS